MKKRNGIPKVNYHGNKEEKSLGSKKNPNVANVSRQGYRDDSPYNTLPYIDIHTPSGRIDMSGTGIPLWANGRILPPYSGIHQFDTTQVKEIPLAKKGGWLEKYQGTKGSSQTGSFINYNAALNQANSSFQPSTTRTAAPAQAAVKNAAFVKRQDAEKLSDEAFKEKYGIGKHRYMYETDPAYRATIDKEIQAKEAAGMPMLKQKVDVNPNLMFMAPNATSAEQAQNAIDYNLLVQGAALPIPGLQAMGKIPSVFDAASGMLAASKESGLLSNAWRLNPRAVKQDPHLLVENSEALYRGIGKSGKEDLLQSKILRSRDSKSFPDPYFVKGSPPGAYSQGYIAELKNEPGVFKDFAIGNKEIYTTKPVSLENPNLKIYQQLPEGYRELSKTTGLPLKESPHWWKGYPQVNTPTQLPGSPNASYVVEQSGFPNPLAIADAIIPRGIHPVRIPLLGAGPEGLGPFTGSPLNFLPGYGVDLGVRGRAYRKFGNTMSHVMDTKTLSPKGGSSFRIGRDQIVNEGNWAALNAPDEAYSGVFAAEFDFRNPGNKLAYITPSRRNGVLITDSKGNLLPDIPITEQGLQFHRRLPFSNRYIPIDKDKLLNDQFQLATQGGYLQSLIEKYGYGLGYAGLLGALGNSDAVNTYNEYTIDPLLKTIDPALKWADEQWKKNKPIKKQEGGSSSGENYNMQRAEKLYTPDETGHWPSIDHETGEWLKSKEHPTAWMEYLYGYTLNPQQALNYDVRVKPEGYFGENTLQYVPKQQTGGSLPKAQTGRIVVNDLNDPRLTAYQDSLALYNDYNRLKNVLDSQYSNSDYIKKQEDFPRNPDGSICYNCIKKEAERKKQASNFISTLYNKTQQLANPNIDPKGYINYLKDNLIFDESQAKIYNYSNVKPVQQVIYQPNNQLAPIQNTYDIIREDVIPIQPRGGVFGNMVPEMQLAQPDPNTYPTQMVLPTVDEIMMPSGQMISRKAFIKQYGEAAWDRANNQGKYKRKEGGSLPMAQNGREMKRMLDKISRKKKLPNIPKSKLEVDDNLLYPVDDAGVPVPGGYPVDENIYIKNLQPAQWYIDRENWRNQNPQQQFPMEAKRGGWLKRYQGTEEGSQTTGLFMGPEEEQKQGVARVMGADQEGTPVLRPTTGYYLPEVNVTAERPDTYNNYMLNKYKDAGLGSSMFMLPMDYVFGYPQAAATKMMTGKYQLPSEAMGIENPIGALATDLVLDPANLVGAGLLNKEAALAKLSATKNKTLYNLGRRMEGYAIDKMDPSILREYTMGFGRGFQDIAKGRPKLETFPLTKKQRLAVWAQQDEALKEGQDFTKSWYHAPDGSMRPEVAEKIQDMFPGGIGGPFQIRPKHFYLQNTKNPFNTAPAQLAPTRSGFLQEAFLKDPTLPVESIKFRRGLSEGFFSPDLNKNISFRNRGFYQRTPEDIMETATHETTHVGQEPFRDILSMNATDITPYRISNFTEPIGKTFYQGMVKPKSWAPKYNELIKKSFPNETGIESLKKRIGTKNWTAEDDALLTKINDEFQNFTSKKSNDYYSWSSSPLELHAETMVGRKKLADWLLMNNRANSMEDAIQMIQNPSEGMIDWMINHQNLNQFFNPKLTPEKKRALIRMLPAAAGVGSIYGLSDGQSQDGLQKQRRGGSKLPPHLPEAYMTGGLTKHQVPPGQTAARPAPVTSDYEESVRRQRENLRIPTDPKASKKDIDLAYERRQFIENLQDQIPYMEVIPLDIYKQATQYGQGVVQYIDKLWKEELERRKGPPIEELQKMAEKEYGRTLGSYLGDIVYNLDSGWNPFASEEDIRKSPGKGWRRRPLSDTEEMRTYLTNQIMAAQFDKSRREESERLGRERFFDLGNLNADIYSQEYSTLPWVSSNWRGNLYRDTQAMGDYWSTNPAKGITPFDIAFQFGTGAANPYALAATYGPIMGTNWGTAPYVAEQTDSYTPYLMPAVDVAMFNARRIGKGLNYMFNPSNKYVNKSILETAGGIPERIDQEAYQATLRNSQYNKARLLFPAATGVLAAVTPTVLGYDNDKTAEEIGIDAVKRFGLGALAGYAGTNMLRNKYLPKEYLDMVKFNSTYGYKYGPNWPPSPYELEAAKIRNRYDFTGQANTVENNLNQWVRNQDDMKRSLFYDIESTTSPFAKTASSNLDETVNEAIKTREQLLYDNLVTVPKYRKQIEESVAKEMPHLLLDKKAFKMEVEFRLKQLIKYMDVNWSPEPMRAAPWKLKEVPYNFEGGRLQSNYGPLLPESQAPFSVGAGPKIQKEIDEIDRLLKSEKYNPSGDFTKQELDALRKERAALTNQLEMNRVRIYNTFINDVNTPFIANKYGGSSSKIKRIKKLE